MTILGGGAAQALPRFSLLTGTRCSVCHFEPSGGGLRTELGWSHMNEVGALKWTSPPPDPESPESSEDPFGEDPGTTESDSAESTAPPIELPEETVGFFSSHTNTLFDGLLTPGLDIRGQLAKVGNPPDEKMKFIPMQLSPSLGITLSEQLNIYGGVNVGGIVYKAMHPDNATYAGMSDFNVAVQYMPDIALPSIRVGLIQPSIGIRQDDHTAFVRREAAQNGNPIIPPDYNDVGAEITYEGLHWLTINAGVFNSYHLSKSEFSVGEVSSLFDFSKPSYLARVVLWPQLLDHGLNGEVGASYFINGDFKMINAFAGIGMADKATIFLEGMYSTNAADRHVRNMMVTGTYKIEEWFSIHWRYDFGQTEYPGEELYHAQAFILGAEFFPLPYIEIRPEYRFFRRDQFNQSTGTFLGEYVAQLHIFY